MISRENQTDDYREPGNKYMLKHSVVNVSKSHFLIRNYLGKRVEPIRAPIDRDQPNLRDKKEFYTLKESHNLIYQTRHVYIYLSITITIVENHNQEPISNDS